MGRVEEPDREALLARCFRAFRDEMLVVAARLAKESADILYGPEDLVQEAYIEAWRALDTGRSNTPAALLCFFRAVLKNHSRNILRARRRETCGGERRTQSVDQDRTLRETIVARDAGPLDLLLSMERMEATLAVLGELRVHPRTREILALVLFQQAAISKAAGALGMSRAAAYQALERATDRAKARLRQRSEFRED